MDRARPSASGLCLSRPRCVGGRRERAWLRLPSTRDGPSSARGTVSVPTPWIQANSDLRQVPAGHGLRVSARRPRSPRVTHPDRASRPPPTTRSDPDPSANHSEEPLGRFMTSEPSARQLEPSRALLSDFVHDLVVPICHSSGNGDIEAHFAQAEGAIFFFVGARPTVHGPTPVRFLNRFRGHLQWNSNAGHAEERRARPRPKRGSSSLSHQTDTVATTPVTE